MNDLPNARAQGKPFDSSAKGWGAQGKPFVVPQSGTPQGKPDDQLLTNNQQPRAVTSGHPEKESSTAPLEEVKESVELTPEVEKAGVKHIRGEIQLSHEDKAAGIEAAAETTPVSFQSAEVANTPLNEEQIEKALRYKIADSILWLATWCLRQLKVIHHKIRG